MSKAKKVEEAPAKKSSEVLSEQEFLDLIEKYRHEFYRYVHRTIWNASDVEDVFSDAVMAAWRQRERFQVGSNFRAWMYKILTNKAYVANRHTQRNSIDLESINPERFTAPSDDAKRSMEDSNWFLEQVDDNLYGAMDKLRPQEKACLMLRAIQSCTYKEIAEVLEIPVGTVMTHLARGRAKARKLLEVAVA
jgi:RNA polymerase sigma-70 factor (ECF subfamily)